MRGSAVSVLAAVLVAFCMAGCGRKSAQPPPKPAAQKNAVPLPEWAPKNPSPEFLRAARVLKPMPEEMLRGMFHGATFGGAVTQRYSLTFPAAYEFFGTLSDEQIGRFLSSKEEKRKILIMVKSLSAKQQAALEEWYRLWHASGIAPDEPDDYRVFLYRNGAEENLSNARVGFVAQGKAVHVLLCVMRSKGHNDGVCAHFAML
jgi:predicted small lipoprotein YifL